MKFCLYLATVASVLVTLGCSNSKDSDSEGMSSDSMGEQYLATIEPSDSKSVGEARQMTKDGERVAVVGHIGGSAEPFVQGLAAFTIVDPKVEYCQPDEGCPTPWDYCCKQNEVKDNIATVKIIDEQGKPVSQDARRLLGVKELALVVVEGIAKRDDQGNLTVNATKIFVRH